MIRKRNYAVDEFGCMQVHESPAEQYDRERLRNGRDEIRTPRSHPYSFDEHTIWAKYNGNDGPAKCGDYSDRLYEWDSVRYSACVEKHLKDYHGVENPTNMQDFLRDYHDDPTIVLYRIIKGCNASSGYPYWVFIYYRDPEHQKYLEYLGRNARINGRGYSLGSASWSSIQRRRNNY